MKKKMSQFELFGWGAFATLTILQFEKYTGLDPGIWGKVAMGLLILACWLVYIFKPDSSRPESTESEVVTLAQERKVLIFVILGALLAFAFTLILIGGNR